jgi:SH3-like domain-containing protein
MIARSALLSLVVLAGTVGSAFAGYAHVEDTTKVREAPSKYAASIGWAKEGKKVWVGDCHKGFCYIEQKGGADGWVKKSDLDFISSGKKSSSVEFCFGGGGFPGPGYGYVQFCVED